MAVSVLTMASLILTMAVLTYYGYSYYGCRTMAVLTMAVLTMAVLTMAIVTKAILILTIAPQTPTSPRAAASPHRDWRAPLECVPSKYNSHSKSHSKYSSWRARGRSQLVTAKVK